MSQFVKAEELLAKIDLMNAQMMNHPEDIDDFKIILINFDSFLKDYDIAYPDDFKTRSGDVMMTLQIFEDLTTSIYGEFFDPPKNVLNRIRRDMVDLYERI